jgi:HPr kinase/phosphorylase
MYTVLLSSIIREFDLKLLTEKVNIDDKVICHPEINRPALQLAGFYDYFDSDRLQIIGKVEYAYLEKMSMPQRRDTIYRMFANKIPCLVLCREIVPYPDMIQTAEEFDIPILGSQDSTTDFMGGVITWLKAQ